MTTGTTEVGTARTGLRWKTRALVVATFALLVAGAQVTSTDSGDSVDSWPLPLKVPAVLGHPFWELAHRAVAGAVALLSLWILVSAIRGRRRGDANATPTVLRLACGAAALVLAEALLGGLRVVIGTHDARASTPDESALL